MRNTALLSSPFFGLGLLLFGTIAVALLCVFAFFGLSISVIEMRSDRSHAAEVAFYAGVMLSSPLWLLGTWTTGIALAVGARPRFRWVGYGLCAAAATVFMLVSLIASDVQS